MNSIFHYGTFPVQSVLAAALLAFALGVAIALIYKATNAYMDDFAITLAIIPMIVTFVIMIVNGNLGTSVAVLGAFGLIRFRSAPGSAREIGFIFLSMAVGLATGLGFLTLAAFITVVVGGAIVLLEKIRFGKTMTGIRELNVTIPENLNYSDIFEDLFDEYTRYSLFEKVKTTNMGTMYELVYRVELKNADLEKEFIDKIRCRNGNLPITMGFAAKNKGDF